MVLIPAGDFLMGDQSSGKIGQPEERPVHTVHVSAFLIGNCEVTKAEWDKVASWARQNGFTDLAEGRGYTPDHPVNSVEWYDALKWCNARSLQEGLQPCYSVNHPVAGTLFQVGADYEVFCDWSANGYRLPTEAEWEKAARGGKVGKDYPWGDSINHSRATYRKDTSPSKLTKLWNDMWDKISPGTGKSRIAGVSSYHPTYKCGTAPVASFPANGYGLHDMAGNLNEWCWDMHGDYPSSSQTDPRGPPRGDRTRRIIRGGSYDVPSYVCRVAARSRFSTDMWHHSVGFRIARSSVPQAGGGGRSGESVQKP